MSQNKNGVYWFSFKRGTFNNNNNNTLNKSKHIQYTFYFWKSVIA